MKGELALRALRPRGRLSAVPALAGLLLAVGAVLTVVDPGLRIPHGATLIGAAAALAAGGWWAWRSRGSDLAAPTVFFPLLLLAFYGFGALPLTSWGGVLGGAYYLALLAAAAFVVGALLVGRDRDYVPLGRRDTSELAPSSLLVGLAVAGLTAVTAFAVVLLTTGVPVVGTTTIDRLASSDNGYLNTLALSIRAVMLVAVVLILTVPAASDWRAVRLTAIAAVGAGATLLFTTGNRGHLVLMFLVVALAWHYLRRRAGWRTVLVVGVLGVTVYSFAGYLRAAQFDSQWAGRIEQHYGIPSALATLAPGYLSVRSVTYYLSETIDAVPAEYGYRAGAVLAAPLLSPLPGRQPGVDQVVKEEILRLDFAGFGVAVGLFAPAYIDFGYFGVVATCLAAGAAMQWLYQRARTARPEWVAVYLFAAANLTLSVYGSLVNSFSVLLVPALAYALLALARRKMAPATDALSQMGSGRLTNAPRVFSLAVVTGYGALVAASIMSVATGT
jgi:hypothetical protein